MIVMLWIVALTLVGLAVLYLKRQRTRKREAFIRRFSVPEHLLAKLRTRHPQLSQADCQLVAGGLRQFFLAYLNSGHGYVSMPSQVVDDLWHEFILHTRAYQAFCKLAFGRFLHHTPAAALGGQRQSDAGLRRCWWFSCREERIDPRAPSRVPLLFALDSQLGIAGGFAYVADCSGLPRPARDSGGVVHCGSDLSSGCSGGDSGSADFGDSGGDGGGGCGGGGD